MLVPPHSIRLWKLPRASTPRIDAAKNALTSIKDPHEREESARQLYKELTAGGTPIVENTHVTFLWHGDAPHGVLLQLNKVTDYFNPMDTELRPIAGTALRALTLDMPAEWMGSYSLVVPDFPVHPCSEKQGLDLAQVRALRACTVEDPTARQYIPNKTGMARLAVARGAGAPVGVLGGEAELATSSIRSPANGAELRLWISGPSNAQVTLVFLDGEVWAQQHPISPRLADLPVRCIFVDSGGPQQRQLDYAGEDCLAFLQRAIDAGGVGGGVGGPMIVIGQSLGGLYACRTATEHPEIVSAAIAQSPSLWWADRRWFNEREKTGGSPIYLQMGTLEWDLEQEVHEAAALLQAQGDLLGFDTYCGGHDILWWQNLLPGAIRDVVSKFATAERE